MFESPTPNEPKRIHAHVIIPPELGAGFTGAQWDIEDLGPLDLYPEMRENVRREFKRAFATLTGETPRVIFSDELDY